MAIQATWTPDSFLYEVFLTSNTRTSFRSGDKPIDIYNAYLRNSINIYRLCDLGAQIQNFVADCGLEDIEPIFMQKHIWWCFGMEKLFGINLFQSQPRLTFHGCGREMLNEIYPEYEFRYRQQYDQSVCWKYDVSVDDLEELFHIRVMDCLDTEDQEKYHAARG